VAVALGSQEGEAAFELNQTYPAMSQLKTATPTKEGSTVEIRVPVCRLDTLLRQHVPNVHRVDFLNIDCEGAELDILHSFDLGIYHPRVIAVEDENCDENTPVRQFLNNQGYKYRACVGLTKFFAAPDVFLRNQR